MSSAYWMKMTPYANRVASATGIPASFVLAQWSLETGDGSSRAATQLNNHAGIKANSLGADYDGGTYAGYNSINSFVSDYIRFFNKPVHPNYAKAKELAKKGDARGFAKALEGTWAEDGKYSGKILGVLNGTGNTSADAGSTVPGSKIDLDIDGLVDKAKNLNSDQLIKFAAIGLGVVAVVNVLK